LLPFPTRRSSDLLILERIQGEKVTPEHGLPAEQAEHLARQFFRAYIRQVTVEGVYHADPHTGNVLLTDDGRLALLDFGLLGRLDDEARTTLSLLLLALARKTLAQADSIARTLDPELDPISLLEDESRGLMLAEAERNLEPDRFLSQAFTQLGPLTRLPRRIVQIADRLETGTLKVGVSPTDLDDASHMLGSMANRLGAALILVGLLVASALLARVHTFEWVAIVGFTVAAVLGIYMVWKIIRTPGEL